MAKAFVRVMWFLLAHLLLAERGSSQNVNPAILQDSRDLPKVDGAFGFLYRTEDGIAHAAKGEPDGAVRGRFTYTDPTGLKVNFNYNAGSRVTPKYNYNEPLAAYEQNRYTQTRNDLGYQTNQGNQESYQDDGSQDGYDQQPAYQGNQQQQNYQQPAYQENQQQQNYQQPVYQGNQQDYQQPVYQPQPQQQPLQEQGSRPPHLRATNRNY